MTTAYGDLHFSVVEFPGEAAYVVLSRHSNVPAASRLRVQAHCLTSTAFHSAMCDCGAQIDSALKLCASRNDVLFIYLPQEARGYGLLSKVEIMSMMNTGLSLSEAQAAVGRQESRLDYKRVPEILRLRRVERVTLLTQSMDKVEAIRALGVKVDGTTDLSVS
jgi:3,4-dihydroxy 2-butanone 4-phosphate synthase/GTP cyclohydrolase II